MEGSSCSCVAEATSEAEREEDEEDDGDDDGRNVGQGSHWCGKGGAESY